ncbi:hypothetical protein [Pseudomonas fluorescens]|uniref:Uncharacterized protein n=1 Tax=Pseudomonas fluorescens TaxID=294 RepID=A0A0F4UYN0_PSEFL|nr:hypothetical protein [Pseudomonas fluorescens]KJZ60827.1 hypothetical protein VD17_29230 [Pseudomonas fluorescens]
MTRNKPSMIRLGVGAAIVLAVAYVLFPAFQVWIVANALFLLLLLCPLSAVRCPLSAVRCPLSMMFCMRGMHKDAPTTDDTLKVKPIKRDPNDRS